MQARDQSQETTWALRGFQFKRQAPSVATESRLTRSELAMCLSSESSKGFPNSLLWRADCRQGLAGLRKVGKESGRLGN